MFIGLNSRLTFSIKITQSYTYNNYASFTCICVCTLVLPGYFLWLWTIRNTLTSVYTDVFIRWRPYTMTSENANVRIHWRPHILTFDMVQSSAVTVTWWKFTNPHSIDGDQGIASLSYLLEELYKNALWQYLLIKRSFCFFKFRDVISLE